MKQNTFFLYSSKQVAISQEIQRNATSYNELFFLEYLEKHTQHELMQYIEIVIQKKSINILFISLSDCDCSLPLKALHELQKKYNLFLYCIFHDSINSFEYIDRYYAQICDFVIINDIEIVQDFYSMLEIKTYRLTNTSFKCRIKKENIFSSALINLSSDYSSSKAISSSQQTLQEQFHEIFNMMNVTQELKSRNSQILLDKKFIYSQDIFSLYWTLYKVVYNKQYRFLFSLFKLKNSKYLFVLYKLFFRLKLHKNLPIDTINKALYKEYTL